MMTLVFLLATATLAPFSQYAVTSSGQRLRGHDHRAGRAAGLPDSDHHRRTAVGHRHRRHGPHGARQRHRDLRPRRRSGRRRGRAAARQDRHHHARRPQCARPSIAAPGVEARELADAAQLASLADETPEGRSIVVLAKQQFQLRGRDLAGNAHTFHKFSAQTRMSGVDLDGRRMRKGAADAIRKFVEQEGGIWPAAVSETGGHRSRAAARRRWWSPRAAACSATIELRDIVKGGIRERFAELRQMGIKTVMVTGDNRLTAAAIAAEAGVDEFLAEATPEAKLELIRRHQKEGHLVAMCGDGTNDAPALAQADVAVAMNTGTQAAKEAGNMVDLDSNPTKLIEVVDVGKQMLVTRGALTTFSIANDVAKYFAIIPAAFATTYPALDALNVMRLASPESAILSAVIFNALVIIVLVPLALRGVKTRAASAAVLLRRNLLVYGWAASSCRSSASS